MKSLSAKEVSHGRPAPSPVPVRPPDAMPHRPLASWLERSRLSGEKGSSQRSTRFWKWVNADSAKATATPKRSRPMAIHDTRSVAT